MTIPRTVQNDVRNREGLRCRACARERPLADLTFFILWREPTTADNVVQVCRECREAEAHRHLGISGHGAGEVQMHGIGPTRRGSWVTRCA